MKGFKGYNSKLQCTPNGKVFQYEIGKTYEEQSATLCKNGFHFCENPIDIFNYYPPSEARFTEIDAEGVDPKTSDDSKRSCKIITIGAEINLSSLVGAAVKFVFSKVDWTNAKSTNTGYQSAATNTEYQSAATNTGNRSAATNTGDRSAATNTGDQSAATNTGYQSAATNTGDQSAATNTGDQSAATNTGDRSAATNTGDQSAATVGGEESIAIATGCDSMARGSLGCWIVVTERDKNGHILTVKSAKVDGKKIKADTFYKVINGKFIEQ